MKLIVESICAYISDKVKNKETIASVIALPGTKFSWQKRGSRDLEFN